ncbi:MAG: NUDIX domain-containing protein [Rhodospirillaceae bacterium]
MPVRSAATVLLLRDGEDGLEVFMVRRHHLMGFAGDALVFPGGRLDDADAVVAADVKLCRSLPDVGAGALALRVAALRETFEEAGILLARRNGVMIGGREAEAFSRERMATAESAGQFAGFLAREKLTLASDMLIPFARWITPPVYAKRYDTMFFLADAPRDQIGVHDGSEAVDSFWVTPAQALAAGDSGAARVEFATRRNLEKLARSRSTDEAVAAACRSPIVTVLPTITQGPRGRLAHLPAEADYGGTVFDFG